MACIDEILGAGASARLGLDENNAAPIYDVLDAINEACMAEKQRYTSHKHPQAPAHEPGAAPGREKAQARPEAAGRELPGTAARRPDGGAGGQKAARRKALLAELAALDD